MKKLLIDLNKEELEALVIKANEKRFRADQLFHWTRLGARFEEMTNLPKSFVSFLMEEYFDIAASIKEHYKSEDGTIKFLLELTDGSLIESVLMSYSYGYTLCVSSQVGCRMGCKFCASGLDGLSRNLSAGEMLSEVIAANRFIKENLSSEGKVGNVVIMGSGEPLDNYDNVVKFIKMLSSDLLIGQRSVSLSTCGLCDKIKMLPDSGISATLCISLHSPFDEIRKTIMPVANAYAVESIMEAAKYYFTKTGRRIIIEYAMMKGVNTSKKDVERLKELTKGFACHINLIPLNDTGASLKGVNKKEAYSFLNLVKQAGLSATVRRSLGQDIAGACGQLKRRYNDENK